MPENWIDLDEAFQHARNAKQKSVDDMLDEAVRASHLYPDDTVIFFEAEDHGVPPHDPFAEFLRDDLAQQARKAQEEWARQKASYHQSSTAWDAPDGSPWLDVMNASRLFNGEPKIIDARFPKGDVYVITEVK